MTDFVIDPVAIGKRIRGYRVASHLTVRALADEMNQSEQAIYKWQRGESIPTVDNLVGLSYLFGVSIDAIIKGEREEDNSPLLSVFMGTSGMSA